MSPLEASILADGVENSIYIPVVVYYPYPIMGRRTMSNLAYKLMRSWLGPKRAPHPPRKRGRKPRRAEERR